MARYETRFAARAWDVRTRDNAARATSETARHRAWCSPPVAIVIADHEMTAQVSTEDEILRFRR